jgi:hypothetical protein
MDRCEPYHPGQVYAMRLWANLHPTIVPPRERNLRNLRNLRILPLRNLRILSLRNLRISSALAETHEYAICGPNPVQSVDRPLT